MEQITRRGGAGNQKSIQTRGARAPYLTCDTSTIAIVMIAALVDELSMGNSNNLSAVNYLSCSRYIQKQILLVGSFNFSSFISLLEISFLLEFHQCFQGNSCYFAN